MLRKVDQFDLGCQGYSALEYEVIVIAADHSYKLIYKFLHYQMLKQQLNAKIYQKTLPVFMFVWHWPFCITEE